MRSYADIPPEFHFAFNKMYKRLAFLSNNQVPSSVLQDQFWEKDNLSHVYKLPKIRNIPSGSEWRWNQAKRKYNFKKNGMKVEIMKLVPRRLNKNISSGIPKVKLWQAYITNTVYNPIVLFWTQSTTTQEESKTIPDIQNYSFLAPFMDDNELGREIWPLSNLSFPIQDLQTIN